MQGLFGRSKHKVVQGPATTSVRSNRDRPKQERRHSGYVEGGPSHRPGIFTLKSWHTSSTGEPSPKLPKSPRQSGGVRSFFRRSSSPDDEDDGGLEFMCKGVDSRNPVRDGGSSNRDNASFKPVQRRVSTRSRSTARPKIRSSRSSSENSLALRETTSPVSSSTYPKSPYPNSSAKTSYLEPRSLTSVYKTRNLSEDSGTVSDPEKNYRGRDGRNSSRHLGRDVKAKPPNDGIDLPKRDRNGKNTPNHHPPRTLTDRNYHQDKPNWKPSHQRKDGYDSSHNEHKIPSGRRDHLKTSAPKTAGNRDKIGSVTRVPLDDHKTRPYQVQDYRKFNSVNLNRQYRVQV
ncbi:uncharacterized protein EAE97_006970 [Botrytis byssoidea]|uniref:Uncharacterized protein n=1 Tax=Botrytis byssoidea TaxID=139641 RepID=A0A9P5IM83_9HELO|nr:uncharacterized protein EAE97_006970 [Botrytis byssoidea]KAF7940784.1 hypothetical protein EAE97_006970 [Botrytis byssoidea]